MKTISRCNRNCNILYQFKNLRKKHPSQLLKLSFDMYENTSPRQHHYLEAENVFVTSTPFIHKHNDSWFVIILV